MTTLSPGFTDAGQAQTCFRAILRALSRPGEIVPVPGIAAPGLSPAAAATLLTLADQTTALAAPEAARDWLVFHTGARIAPAGDADFIATATRPALATLRQGSDDEPESAATLILDCETFATGRPFRLTGPGIETERRINLPLDADFAAEWQAQRACAPRGIDLLLCAGSSLLGLPRSLTIEAL